MLLSYIKVRKNVNVQDKLINRQNKILIIAQPLLGDMMKKILIFTLFCLFLIPINKVYSETNLAEGAKSAILIEASTGEILYQKNAYEKLPPASMTKMMSMLLIMEEIEKGNLKWDEMITASDKAASMGGSQIFLKAGEKMSTTDMLKGISIASGNELAVSIKQS